MYTTSSPKCFFQNSPQNIEENSKQEAACLLNKKKELLQVSFLLMTDHFSSLWQFAILGKMEKTHRHENNRGLDLWVQTMNRLAQKLIILHVKKCDLDLIVYAQHNKTAKTFNIHGGTWLLQRIQAVYHVKHRGGHFQTTVNKTADNYIDPVVGGMISHEKTTLTTWTRCRARLLCNIKKTQFGWD